MDRPFNYILSTSVSTLVKPYDEYGNWYDQRLANNNNDDSILKCIEETYRVYKADPTIQKFLSQMVKKLCTTRYHYRLGTNCAIQNRTMRNQIVEKLVELFGSLFTLGLLNIILRKSDKLKIGTIRKLCNANGGNLVNQTTIDKLCSIGIECKPIVTTINRRIKSDPKMKRRKQLVIDSNQVLKYIMSDKQFNLFSKIIKNIKLKLGKLDNLNDFDPDSEEVKELYASIRTQPLIKRIQKIIINCSLSDFELKLYEMIVKKYANKKTLDLNIVVSLIIVIDAIDCPVNLFGQILRKVKDMLHEVIGTSELQDTKSASSLLKILIQFGNLHSIEMVDRKIITKVAHDNNIEALIVLMDPAITSYDPIPDLLAFCNLGLIQNMNKYVEHLLKHSYLRYDLFLAYLISLGIVSYEKFGQGLEEHRIDIFDHELTGHIINNMIRFYDTNMSCHISNDSVPIITRLYQNKHCFDQQNIDNIILEEHCKKISNARLSFETDENLKTIDQMVLRSNNLKCKKGIVYRDVLVRIIRTMTPYQKYEFFKEVQFPKKQNKVENIDEYISRIYELENTWDLIKEKVCKEYLIQTTLLDISSEHIELLLDTECYDGIWLLCTDPYYENALQNLNIDSAMSINNYLIRRFVLNILNGRIKTVNSIKFFVPEVDIRYWLDYRKGHLQKAEDEFIELDQDTNIRKRINIIDRLCVYHTEAQEKRITESFNLLCMDNGNDNDNN